MIVGGVASAEGTRGALLEKTGVQTLNEVAGFNVLDMVEKLLSGELTFDTKTISNGLKRLRTAVKHSLLDALSALAAPVLASLLVKTVLAGKEGGMLGLMCRLSCAALLMGRFAQAQAVCLDALQGTVKLTEAASPVLITALTITGATDRTTILTPSASLCAGLIEVLLIDAALPFCGLMAAVAASANLSERFQLNRLFDWMKRCLTWGLGLMLSGFVGLMAIQGLLIGGQDALTARAIQRAVRSALPIVGGEVSDSAGALLASAMSVRSLAGVAGMLAVMGGSMTPIIRLTVSALSLKLASAVLEPVADGGIVRVVGHFGDLSRTLLAICVSGTLLAVLMLGAILTLAAG